jgi:hypothetical protein
MTTTSAREEEPDEPVADVRERLPRLGRGRLLGDQDRDYEERSDNDRQLEEPLDSFGSVHAASFDIGASASRL